VGQAADNNAENLTQWQHLGSIKNEGKIYSACGDGKVPFISAGDIAAVAFHVLTDEKPPQTDYRVLGPELLSHDQVKFPLVTRLVMF
jgi:festuclavine dehydrogenase